MLRQSGVVQVEDAKQNKEPDKQGSGTIRTAASRPLATRRRLHALRDDADQQSPARCFDAANATAAGTMPVESSAANTRKATTEQRRQQGDTHWLGKEECS